MKKLGLVTLIAMGVICTSNLAMALPNPASKNCIDKGGTLKIVNGKGGEVGMCYLPDGVVCEEWALMRNECGTSESKPIMGGWNPISVDDAQVKEAAAFAVQKITKKAKLQKITAAQSQVVAGTNYKLVLQLTNGEKYKVVVSKPLRAGFILQSSTKL